MLRTAIAIIACVTIAAMATAQAADDNASPGYSGGGGAMAADGNATTSHAVSNKSSSPECRGDTGLPGHACTQMGPLDGDYPEH
jgi:hypothetical protein